MKISQYRRLQARAHLEAISAQALLYKYEQSSPPQLQKMAEMGYITPAMATKEYSIDDKLVAHSSRYKTVGEMNTLLENPIEKVTQNEANAYQNYINNYNQFWRQFFDPIAIRLDDVAHKELELNIFILPLIHSSVYETFREALSNTENSASSLQIPQLHPSPILTVSINLQEKIWMKFLNDVQSLFHSLGIPSSIFDEFGSSLHLAIMDADPIINLGSGDILGALGAKTEVFFGRSPKSM